MFFDPLYMMIMAVCLILSAAASFKVKTAFAAGKRIGISSGLSGAETAERILRANGITGVSVIRGRGYLTDHYNPVNRRLVLSPEVYDGTSASSVGVAAHETGHAIQHAVGYKPLRFRSAIVPLVNIGSSVGLWMVIIGVILGSAYQAASGHLSLGYYLALTGVILYATVFLFSFITVPVEIDASHRALKELQRDGIVRTETEAATVKSVLSAAALTYVAAVVGSLLQLFYWILRSGILNRRD